MGQRALMWQIGSREQGWDLETNIRATPHDSLPQGRLHRLKNASPPKIAPTPGRQVSHNFHGGHFTFVP